jgi:hypothetical protein
MSVGGVTNVAARGFSQGPLAGGSPADMILAVEHAAQCAKKSGGHRAEFVDIANFIAPEAARVVEH